MTIKLFCRPSILDREDAEGAIIVSALAVVLWIGTIIGILVASSPMFPLFFFGGLGTMFTWFALWLWGVHMNPFGWKDCDD
jgi:protein-S-isoprenylcysteine O-methyltransferase Ste14